MSAMMKWMRGLSTPVQIALIVAVVVLLLAAMWFGLKLDWFPGWLSS